MHPGFEPALSDFDIDSQRRRRRRLPQSQEPELPLFLSTPRVAAAFDSAKMTTLFPVQSELMALAPTELRNYRSRRYHGDNMALSTSALTAGDQASIRRLYSFLQGLFKALSVDEEARRFAFQTFLDGEDLDALIAELRTLGAASCEADPSPLVVTAMHDVRGGGLTPLIGQLELWRLGVLEQWPGDSLYFLTRDHLKIMRNALLGLDDAKRNEDLEIKVHGTDFFVEKWNGSVLAAGERKVLLEVDCPQPVAISECCVEFGALDRILYNLINNACRHTSGTSIQLVLFPVPDPHGENLRFVLLNSLSSGDQAHLHGADLQSLFRAGVSTTGSGFGLHVAAEFVTNAFGLPTQDEAVGGGYLGAQLLDEKFAIWFHWPIVAGY